LVVIIALLLFSDLLLKWSRRGMERALGKIGLTNDKKMLHGISSEYHEIGINVPHILLIEPHLISNEAENYVKVKLFFEAIKIIAALTLPTILM